MIQCRGVLPKFRPMPQEMKAEMFQIRGLIINRTIETQDLLQLEEQIEMK